MALNKTITNEKGIATSYHKIGDVIVNKLDVEALDGEAAEQRYALSISVESFVSSEFRQKSERLIAERRSLMPICTLEEIESIPLMTLCYKKLKENEVFAGAEDC